MPRDNALHKHDFFLHHSFILLRVSARDNFINDRASNDHK